MGYPSILDALDAPIELGAPINVFRQGIGARVLFVARLLLWLSLVTAGIYVMRWMIMQAT